MGIVTKEMIEESKNIDLAIIDKDIYENAKAIVEIHRHRTGLKPQWTAMDTVRLRALLDSKLANQNQ